MKKIKKQMLEIREVPHGPPCVFRIFRVYGTSESNIAMTAEGIPRLGDAYRRGSKFKADDIWWHAVGPNFQNLNERIGFEVTVLYRVP